MALVLLQVFSEFILFYSFTLCKHRFLATILFCVTYMHLFYSGEIVLSIFHHFDVFLYFLWSGKRRGKKKRDGLKDVARDHRIPPSVLFLQCQICLAEGLTMVIVFNF